MVAGLWGRDTVSFESVQNPDEYLRLNNGQMSLERRQLGSEKFASDCSFRVWSNKFFDGYVSFEKADQRFIYALAEYFANT